MATTVRLLGPVTVETAGGALRLSSAEAEVLAALLLSRPGGLADDVLGAVVLPPGTPPGRVPARLERIVTALFADLRAAGTKLSVTRHGDRWRTAAAPRSVDADDLARVVARARTFLDDGRPGDARAVLDLGLSVDLVEERPLDGLDDPWFTAPRRALLQLQRDALVLLADADFALGDADHPLPGLLTVLRCPHLAGDVRLWDRLAVALVTRGRRDEALTHLDAAVATLAEARPQQADALRALREQVAIASAALTGRVARTPAARTPPSRPSWVRRTPPPPWTPPPPPAWGTAPTSQDATQPVGPALRIPPAQATTQPAAAPAPARTQPPDPLRWNLFGAVTLSVGTRAARLDAGTRAALAALLARRGSAVTAAELAAAVWPQEQPPDPVEGLDVLLARAGEAVAPAALPVVRSDPAGAAAWTLRTATGDVDVDRAAAAVDRARSQPDPGPRADGLRAALAGIAAAPLPGLPGVWFDAERDRLAAWREGLLLDAVAADLAAGTTGRALPDLRRLVDLHPLREDLWEWLVVATARHEGRAAGLAVYDRAVHRLDRLLGADPGPRLRAARRQVEEGSA